MAYYDALIAIWPSVPGATTAAKLVNLNNMTVSTPQKAILRTTDIINAIVVGDFPNTTLTVTQVQLLIGGRDQVDASIGTTVRGVFQNIFTGKTQTLANLSALVSPYDNATTPWWKVNGYPRPFDLGDIAAAGLS